MKRENIKSITLGQFQMISEKVIISDPCYKRGTWCQGFAEPVMLGNWTGLLYQKELSYTYDNKCYKEIRNSHLFALHESFNMKNMTSPNQCLLYTDWEYLPFDIGVDSGQAGIFDDKAYQNDAIYREDERPKFGDGDGKFYGYCCDITLDSPVWAGVIKHGIVSRSGFGDGGYRAYQKKNKDGKIIAISIEFISNENEDDEEL